MAFMGIFLVGILAFVFFLMLLSIFIPCLIIAIINLVKGIQNHWPKRNVIPLAITGSISLIFIILFTIYFVWRIALHQAPTTTSSNPEMLHQLFFLLKL